MAYVQKVAARLLVLGVLLAGCTGSSVGEVGQDTPTAAPETADETPTESAAPTEDPTATPAPAAPQATDAERIAAAVAAFDAAPEPTDLIAWDHLNATITADTVRLTVCAWDGDTVFDSARFVEYEVVAADEPAPRFLSSTSSAEPCLNTNLIDSALEATATYDEYWSNVLSDPTTFNPQDAAAIMSPGLLAINSESVVEWNADGLSWKSEHLDGDLPQSSDPEVLWRRYDANGDQVLELLACRELIDEYGLYRGAQLVDDFRGGNATGPHAIDQYRLVRTNGEWRLVGVIGLVWADCLSFEQGWIDGVNAWQPEPSMWQALP